MPSSKMPNSQLMKGRIRKEVIQTLGSVNQGGSSATQTEEDIPTRGDIIGISIQLTQTTTGTLTTPVTIEKAIENLTIKDVSGRLIWSKMRGQDLTIIDRYLNIGNSRTVPTATDATAKAHSWFIPLGIEKKDQKARMQVTIAPFSAMAASGATAGVVSIKIVAWYADESKIPFTQRFQRITETLNSGLNRYAPDLPKNVPITNIFLKFNSAESNLSELDFTADGNTELRDMTAKDLTVLDDVVLTDGHVSDEFSLYNVPFVATSKTIFDVTGSGSDTVEMIVLTAD